MNWIEIQEKYPKALKLYAKCDWWSIVCEQSDYCNNRDLYDFFDEQDIYINLSLEWEKKKWFYDIEYSDEIDDDYMRVSPKYSEGWNRKEVEIAAFIGAFQLLEERLTDEK